jgi:hypothetical protein
MSSDKEQHEARYYGLYDGVVEDVADPQGLARIRVRVPGVLPGGSAWAYPFGGPGAGAGQRGLVDVPSVGSAVGVMFLGGDPEHPRWCGGNWGKPQGETEVPTPFKAIAPADSDKVKAWETSRWLFTLDERKGQELMRLEDKVSGDFIAFDGHQFSGTMKFTTLLTLQVDGILDLKATQIQIGGRTLLQNGKPIQ